MMNAKEINTATDHLLIAALWADCPEGTRPRATRQARKVAHAAVTKFAELMGPMLWAEVKESDGYGAHPDAGSAAAALGHDIYLTCAGHGAGFWDRDELPEDLRTALTSLCGWRGPMGEISADFYRGWLYLSH